MGSARREEARQGPMKALQGTQQSVGILDLWYCQNLHSKDLQGNRAACQLTSCISNGDDSPGLSVWYSREGFWHDIFTKVIFARV